MIKAVANRGGFWKQRHHLDKMTFRELVIAYFQYPAIIAYFSLALLAIIFTGQLPATIWQLSGAVLAALIIYPLAWYSLHRWVLHGRWMFKIGPMAATWKRIHYDHHQDPNHLEVLFGALHTTLPTIVLASMPVGYAIGGWAGAWAALATGLLATAFYEFCHCIQHLAYKPRSKWLAAIKARHMAHHFHDETGNFGITNFAWDKLFGTFYERHERKAKSPTVFNLGYTHEVAQRYPKVMELSGGIVATGHPRQRD
jgi:sterol desaturase/sphingolipid hydroxylase (fatty acid hydroxylase superfamily)